MTKTIVVLDILNDATAAKLRALLPTGFLLTHAEMRGDAHLKDIIAAADFAIAGQVAVSGDVLRSAKRLKLLHKWGVGVDNLDLEAAKLCGICVARTTGSNAVPVAEFAIGLMLSALRCISYGHAELKKGDWRGGRLPTETLMLSGKTVGIIGFGAIGQNLARLLKGFGCTLIYNKRTPLDQSEEVALGVQYATLPDLLTKSDVISLHCPLTEETTGLINKASLSSMKRTAVLVNVARGGVVVEPDLIWALRNGIIHSAAMDVFETEPLPADSALLTLDNLVVTPHLAAIAADNFEKTVRQMFGNIERVALGEPVTEQDFVV
jgi:phosphoglycerate dehydrogenase-like enzyme